MAERKTIWHSLSEERDQANIIIEEEEVKENFSLTQNDFSKGSKTPFIYRAAASTNISTVNTNQTQEAGGADYCHVANSFKFTPDAFQKNLSFVVKYSSYVAKEGVKKVTSRSLMRGR